jgi:predicted P-loop ATPase
MIMNSEYLRIWKEVVVAYVKILCWHLSEDNEESLNVASLAKILTGYRLNMGVITVKPACLT